jgi:hypothetical protein
MGETSGGEAGHVSLLKLSRFILSFRETSGGEAFASYVLIIRLIQLVFFQLEQYFFLKKNQSTLFFSRLIILAERGLSDFDTS